MPSNLQLVLASRPQGRPTEDNFRLVESAIPQPDEGQVLVRNLWLSIDPYMRGRMLDLRTYADPVPIGGVMVGDTAGEVVSSRHPDFVPGDHVVGYQGWQLYGVSDAGALRKVDSRKLPLSAYLGVAGMPGVTAYVGMLDICEPKTGDIVVVTAASGAVGSVAGQLAKLRGCRVVGVAGGPEKCRYVIENLGFDDCLDYKSPDLRARLMQALPQGVDCVFENVGGEVFGLLVARLNHFSRVALCGAISELDNPSPQGLQRLLPLVVNRTRIQGFIVGDRAQRWPVAIADLSDQAARGRIRYHESVAEGLAAAPSALLGVLQGHNLGKQLVRLQ